MVAQDAARARFLAAARSRGIAAVDEMDIPGSTPQGAADSPAEPAAPPVDSAIPEFLELDVDLLPVSTIVIRIKGERREYPVMPLTVEGLLKADRLETRMRYWQKRANDTEEDEQAAEFLRRVQMYQRMSITNLIPAIPSNELDQIVNNATLMVRLTQFASKLVKAATQGTTPKVAGGV